MQQEQTGYPILLILPPEPDSPSVAGPKGLSRTLPLEQRHPFHVMIPGTLSLSTLSLSRGLIDDLR